MQDKYVGDIGDFGKYILLNEICKEFKLGVKWFYVNEEKQTDDKEYRYRYLKNEYKNSQRYERCSPKLYKKLKSLGVAEDRTRRNMEPWGTPPRNGSLLVPIARIFKARRMV